MCVHRPPRALLPSHILCIQLNANIARIMQEAWQRLPDDWDIVLLGCDSRPLQVGAVRAWQGGQEPKEVELFGRIIATWG